MHVIKINEDSFPCISLAFWILPKSQWYWFLEEPWFLSEDTCLNSLECWRQHWQFLISFQSKNHLEIFLGKEGLVTMTPSLCQFTGNIFPVHCISKPLVGRFSCSLCFSSCGPKVSHENLTFIFEDAHEILYIKIKLLSCHFWTNRWILWTVFSIRVSSVYLMFITNEYQYEFGRRRW